MWRIRTIRTFVTISMLLLSLASASAEVVWDHQLTDVADDVISSLEPNVKLSDRGEIDILSASVSGQGDDINVTLSLAGARDPDAFYEVTVVADGDDAKTYRFSYLKQIGYMIEGAGLVEDDPEVYISADGKKTSWIIAKDLVSATEKVEVTHAQAEHHVGFSAYVDTVPDDDTGGNGGGNGGGGDGDPVNVRVNIELKKVEHVRYTIEVILDGEESKSLRGEFDTDVDGTVTKTEYDQHIEFLSLEFASWNSTDIKLNDRKHQSKVMTFELQGVIGSATSTSSVTQLVQLDVYFAEPVAAGTHTYSDFLSTSDKSGDMWEVTADSLWTMSAPKDWKFKTNDWSSGLKTYLGSGGTTLTLSGLQMQSDWNTTMGVMTSFVITEKAPSNVEEETPGFGLVISMAGLMAAMIAAVAYKRRR